ncbi:MAG: DUF131 domain-containing protein [Candidatus Bathyarchaeota archaeon]|nr:DUF131 domain-containing protein [Candidatus Bathyarchaeota archaeon]
MLNDIDESQEAGASGSSRWLFLLIAAGLVLIFMGVIVIFAAAAFAGDGGSVSSGVVIFIGPIPIVFGSGPDSGLLVLVGAILAAVSVALFAVMRKKLLSAF